ncbi:TRAP dicarboxylate transporter, DctQ subunit, unknown substrate 5 [Marinobacterium lacunae]|uniref:TRAP transporter small permease protein n=2 Tax=Marinobacterium lacunae TaxID=1232683 RepID=A0A081G017_9GAMM|nr:TRAP dicarboxylate transporter, DctQ subunit, unknown substrate 5 [Marinobacterium lacunae]
MGTATFFALAYTFDKKGHIRVELLLESSGRLRPFLESFSLLAAVAIAAFITWHGYDSAYWAYTYGDKSSGQDATPLWIPQALISTGALVFTICLVDYFCRSLVNLFKPLRWGAGAKPVRSH